LSKNYKISIIGAGSLAWHLAQELEKADHLIIEVFSRKLKNARTLTSRLYDAVPTDKLNFSSSIAEVFIIAVTDDAIPEVTSKILFPENAVVAHTSGSSSHYSQHPAPSTQHPIPSIGVFYPLQTFTKHTEVNFKEIPICIEALDETTENVLTEIAKSISEKVLFLNSEKRKALHLAAVFACNFTNHLLSNAKTILDREGLEFSLLEPLIIETIEKALEFDPDKVQTGPAARRDKQLINDQFKYLKKYPELQKIYKSLTESILK